ncbi:MAG: response regulator transcription factor, partial [Fidelibacterota bacterium]
RQLREEGRSTPILILSAMSHVDDRVEGLELGADDYLIKPFAMDELLARVQALIRRNSIQNTPNLQIGTIELNTLDRTVTVAGKTVALSNKEFALLEYLMRHAGRALDRYQILEHVWGDTTMDETNVVDVYITYLRRKIDQPGLDSPIKTIRGFGYTFQKKD